VVEKIQLSDEERKLYQLTRDHASAIFQNKTRESGTGTRFGLLLKTILHLRQICNHNMDLLPPKLRARLQGRLAIMDGTACLDFNEVDNCEACGKEISDEEFENITSRHCCPHVLCLLCMTGFGLSRKKHKQTNHGLGCPLCFPFEAEIQKTCRIPIGKEATKNYRPSSKVKALLRILRNDLDSSLSTSPKRYYTLLLFYSIRDYLSQVHKLTPLPALSFLRGQRC